MGRPDYIFGQFRETARCRDAQHGTGFVAISHHSLFPVESHWTEAPHLRDSTKGKLLNSRRT